MRTLLAKLGVLSLLLVPHAQSDTKETPHSELETLLVEIKNEFEVSDEELAQGIRKFFKTTKAIQSITKREDLWGPDGYSEEDLEKMIRGMSESFQKMENISMIYATDALTFLNANDIEAAKNHLRKNLASQYSTAISKEGAPNDFILARVQKLAETDAVLDRLIQEAMRSRREASEKPSDPSGSK